MREFRIVILNLPRDELGFKGGEDTTDSKSSEGTSTAVNMEAKKDRGKEVYRFRPSDWSPEVECGLELFETLRALMEMREVGWGYRDFKLNA